MQWLVGAFGVSALWRLVNQLQGGGAVRPQEVAFAGLAGWALYKQVCAGAALPGDGATLSRSGLDGSIPYTSCACVKALLRPWPPSVAAASDRHRLAAGCDCCLPVCHPVALHPAGLQAEVPLALMIMAAQLVAALVS